VAARDEAVAILRKVVATTGEPAVAAAAELGAILVQSTDPAERDEGMTLLRRAADAGDGGSAVRLANAILSTRFGDATAEEEARALYASALAKKEPGAAEGFARLATDPDVARTYRTQAMMLMKLRSDTSGAAAFALAEAYRTGFGVAADRTSADRYYRQALATGYPPAVSIFVSSSESPPAGIVEGLATALAAGSRDAGLALVRAFMNESALPVSGADAAYVIGLLREIDNPDAAIFEARMLLSGRPPFPRDPAAAERAVDDVIADGQASTAALLGFARQIRDVPDTDDGPRLALKLFLAAAEQGEPQGAVHAVELIAEYGIAVPDAERAKAMALLEAGAEAGNGRSLLLLADLYRDGEGVARSPEKAQELYTRAIEVADEPAAYERLASLILETAYSAADVRRALELYAAASDAGSPAATAAVGRIYLSGRGEFTPDPAEGERLLREAAEAGYKPALVQLANHFARTGIPADLARAEALYAEARDAGELGGTVGLAELASARGDRAGARLLFEEGVAAGSPSAMVGLVRVILADAPDAAALSRARGLVADARRLAEADARVAFEVARVALAFPDEATRSIGLDVLVRLAERGDSAAKKQLVSIYVTGEAGVRSKAEALRWAETALEEGTVEPAVVLGEALLAATDAEFADPVLGRTLLERALAVAPGSVKALNRLGAAYAAGAGGPADPVKAFELFLRAAAAGSVTAEIRVAGAYLNGIGVDRDPAEAYRWYQRAAESGSRDAMVDLARMYASGAGTSIDAEQSFVWFHRAAELGSVESMQEVGKALIAGYGIVQDAAQGERWLVSAAENGSVGAMYDLYSYHSLSDEPASFEEAMRWLRKAADAGSAAAMFRLAQTLRNDERLADRRDEATAWLERAAAAGHKGSRRLLDAMASKTAAVGGAG
jgi:TPR repeat protein